MIPANPFFRQVSDRMVRRQPDKQLNVMGPSVSDINNTAVRQVSGHPRFGFQTMLNQHTSGQLPTAPAIVGGNVDWTKSKVTPVTHHLHNALSGSRNMSPAPMLGSVLRLGEPNNNSIHTTL